jgi:hypothetical protein
MSVARTGEWTRDIHGREDRSDPGTLRGDTEA